MNDAALVGRRKKRRGVSVRCYAIGLLFICMVGLSVYQQRNLEKLMPRERIMENEGTSMDWEEYGRVYQYQRAERRMAPENFQPGCGHPPEFINFFKNNSFKKRSANMEDSIIYDHFFKNDAKRFVGNGFYVEMGAFDGLRESNTRFFDECLRWDGLLIEPNPLIYPKLVKNRNHAHRMSFAPSCQKDNMTVTFHGVRYTSATQLGMQKGTPTGGKFVTVPCGPLHPPLFHLLNTTTPPRRVNFFSLDVEGAEAVVLETLDLNEIQVDVMIAENSNRNCMKICPSREKVRTIMVGRYGYTLYPKLVTKSDLFVHPSVAKDLRFPNGLVHKNFTKYPPPTKKNG